MQYVYSQLNHQILFESYSKGNSYWTTHWQARSSAPEGEFSLSHVRNGTYTDTCTKNEDQDRYKKLEAKNKTREETEEEESKLYSQIGDEIRCSERMNISCSACVTRRQLLWVNPNTMTSICLGLITSMRIPTLTVVS